MNDPIRYSAILLIGPPGSGKGTFGRALGELPDYLFVSAGALLRDADPDSPEGRKIREFQKAGELVPTDTVVDAWLGFMEARRSDGFDAENGTLLLDGLPRSIEQAERISQHLNIQQVIHLHCPDRELLIERIRGRDDDRQDDADKEAIEQRFAIYEENTAPLLRDWFPQGLIESVDASLPAINVLAQVIEAIAGNSPIPANQPRKPHGDKIQ